MVSDRLLALVSCPDCRAPMRRDGDAMRCSRCQRALPRVEGGVLDARPAAAFAETTKYTDAALHADARHEHVSPPLLGAGVRQRMLRRMLRPGPGDRIADLGCGSGRMLVWNAGSGAWLVGVDVSPFFAHEALDQVDLVLGDLRRLPFPDHAFNKAWSLDVFEHLSEPALVEMLAEANRILAPGGELFVYTHVRKNSRLAKGLRGINRLQGWLDRRGLINVRQERLRKSDHLNPLADVPHLERVVHAGGFRLGQIRYYTPLVGGFVENILMRLAEGVLARRQVARAARQAPAGHGPGDPAALEDATDGVRAARLGAKARLERRGPLRTALTLVTRVMMVDLALFGRVKSGPFFAVLVKERDLA